MKTVKIRKIGNSLGVVLPKDVLAMLNAGEGDELSVSVNGHCVRLDVYNEEVGQQVDAGRDIARRYRNTLRELAK